MPKELKLISLTLNNFKGIRSFHLDARGENARVFGDNATGKTTLFDSFLWLLFDKDSQNKKDFSIKTLDVDGKEMHNLEHEVEGMFSLDGRTITLRKVFTEKWTRKRGSASSEFTGHETNYFIDGVPVKKKEYVDRVDQIVKEDIFKLLTSPSFFNEQVKWQDRRKILLEICGDISDMDVIASESKLSRLPEILNGRTIEEHRKVIAAKRSDINKELEKIPVRIDEIKRGMPELDDINKQALEADVTNLNAEIDEKNTLINNIRNGNAISAKQQQIQKLEIEMLDIKQAHEAGTKDKVYQLKAKLQEETSNASILESKLNNARTRKQMQENSVNTYKQTRERLLKEWHEINDKEFKHESDCSCPTCGQALPEEQVQSAKDKALADFNRGKSDRLEHIQNTGKANTVQLEKAQAEIVEIDKEIEKLTTQLNEKKEAVDKLKQQLSTEESMVVDILDNPDYRGKLEEKQKIVAEIQGLRQAADASIQDVYSEIATLKAIRDQKQSEIGKFAYADQAKKRVEELAEQEKMLATEFEKLEGELFLTEEFIRTKVNLLEQKINSRFKYARFVLFENQINGGIQETCITTYKGVPYGTGLNNAARINVGLDICSTLQNHYGIKAPVWVDNRESVVDLLDIDTQVISLVVSEHDKALRVEVEEGETSEEAAS
ncbi:AAA family ATPase [Mesobacillus subterraneus]|uniref:AAA family ATPase n=1 Tax=Mesobacillus subterraneus TaxID=285983 RepID=UPI00203DA362|nr:AAA family ATPase [Mesobacillus subterraneus]MCM3573326.1 AAA family ATPase [Mesobacillus subterraneus]